MKNLIIKSFPEYMGKPMQVLYDHLKQEGYQLAGEKELEECIKNPPEEMKDGNCWYYFFGDLLRGRDGHWSVPSVNWFGDGFNRYAYWLGIGWDAGDRVVLISDNREKKR